MKFLMTLLLALVIGTTWIAWTGGDWVMGAAPAAQQAADKPVRVYLIYDPEGKLWYYKNSLGLIGWTEQSKAEVWTVRASAAETLGSIRGARGKRSVLKAFILIPASDNK